jgi:hypothetical protein
VAARRKEIVDTLRAWLRNGGAQDVLNDGALFAAFQAFLRDEAEKEREREEERERARAQGGAKEKVEKEREREKEELRLALADLAVTFRAQTLRPADRTVAVVDVEVRTAAPGAVEVPNLDMISPQELVKRIDAMALAAMRNVSEDVRAAPSATFRAVADCPDRTCSSQPTCSRCSPRTASAGSCHGTPARRPKMSRSRTFTRTCARSCRPRPPSSATTNSTGSSRPPCAAPCARTTSSAAGLLRSSPHRASAYPRARRAWSSSCAPSRSAARALRPSPRPKQPRVRRTSAALCAHSPSTSSLPRSSRPRAARTSGHGSISPPRATCPARVSFRSSPSR